MKSQKETKESRRRYHDACGAAHGLELIGERWALLVLRELMLGPKRFSAIRADLPGISAKVLTERLEGLEADGLVIRRQLPPPASAWVYEATAWGLEAEPIMQALGRWAVRSPNHDPTMPISPVSLLLSFRTMLDPMRVGDLDLRIGFRFPTDTYVGHLTRDGFAIARGDPDDADLTLIGTAPAIGALVHGGVPVEQSGVTVTGNIDLVGRFATLFPLPPKVATGNS
ncbi:winged helix-turn-helix transcriptional regulator [Sphingomonas sp. ID0503]|uniref:winged helix-turn-helix transcriptional regulator n=1 Tax=Sphingomonas sp. ID0503 TaxID=3399691 RepID=UPI003AFAABBE